NGTLESLGTFSAHIPHDTLSLSKLLSAIRRLLLNICVLQEGTPCGIPKAYGGKQTEEYLRNDKLVFPWTVAIASNLGQFKCLGSIISEEGAPGSKKNSSSLVLTAGNCFRYNILKRWGSTSSFLVFAGVDRFRLFGGGAQKAYIKTIKIFQFATGNDNIWHGIALVTLKAPLMFSKLISPVCVAKQLVPPKSSRCFVSTYVKNQLDEEVVDLVPGALCDFDEFPELRSVGGICSIHQKADSERSFGGPLVCLVDGRAYQFGIYLSQLSVKEALFQNSALHYYGHSAKLFSNDPSISTYVIGLESKPSASKDATSKGCDKAESTLKETDNSCSLKPSKPTTPVDSAEQKGPALCGTTAIFGRTLESYIEGRTAQDMFPWNVFIVTKLRGTVKCIGSVMHAGKYEQHANASDVVLTAAQCFRQNAYTSAALTSSMSVYASSNKYSWFRGKGIKLSIVNIYPYGRGSVKGEAQNELALLKIQRPLSIQDKVIPVCLAPREELPPLESFCYVTHYDILEQRIDEDPVRLTHKRRCSLNQTQNEPNAEGLCTNEEKPKHYVQLGAPMVCIVNGRAYQYGVYLRQHNLQINQKVTQGLGFYCRISKIYDILDGKPVTPPRDNSITKPSEPSIPPTKLPSIFVPAVSTSQSSSSSNEKDATRPKPNVLTVLPSEPNSPSASNLHQGLVYPIKPATKGKSKSSSSSLSISKSRSSSSEQIKEEIEEEPALPEQPAIEQPVLKKNETTIVVKFPQLKYPKFVPKRESNEEPIIVSSVSSESKESEVPVIFPSVRPTPPHAPLPSTPAPVKLESVSKSSSHSRSSSRSSMSGEVIKPAESDEISIPSPPLPSRPCELDTNNPNGVLICPGIRDDGKGITHTVPLPTPVPAAEYPSSSLESSERRIYPSIPEYDMTEQTIASKSSSSSLSISKSRSSSSEQIKEEIEEEPALPEQPAIEQPVLKKNETTIVVKFPQLKYPKFVPKRESNEEPIIVSSVSSESKESEVPVIFPSVRPTPPHGDVPLAPLPSTPAPVKLESVSKSSSHSRSSSRSSMSGEVIKPAESDEISIPSPPLPSRPCELDTNNPNGVLICPGIRDDGKGITHTVPLPTPVPAAEYPSSSLESSERRIYPSIPEYDMTEQTIADHEHILVSDIAVHESAVAGATSTLCTINDDSFSSSQPSAIIGGITSGSNIYDSTGAAAVVSNSASGTHGSASLSGVSTSIGIIHGSASISSGAGLSVGRAHGSVGASSSGIRTSTGTTPGSKGASTGIRSGIGIHGSRGVSSSSSGIHTSIGAMHGSTDISSGVGTSVGRRSSSNCIRNAHGGRDSGNSLIKRLPGANAVHIFDVSQSSVEDVCTGSLHVKAGEVYSDIVLTSARCIWSRVSRKYKVYVGSLLPRHMTMAQFNRTLISVERIFTLPFYSGHSSLKAMGIGVLKLKHKVKVTAGVQSFPLPYPETAPTPRMECFVSGICQHGMPVRVAYQLLSPGDCRSQLGQQFLPSLQYCGIGRKDILKFPVGAPLLCHFFGNWTQFGIYDHPFRFAKPDHLGPGEEAHLNEIAVFTKLESDSVSGALKVKWYFEVSRMSESTVLADCSSPSTPSGEHSSVANLKGNECRDANLGARRSSTKFVHCNLVENDRNCRRPAASSISKKRFARITAELKLNVRLRNVQFDTVNVCRYHRRLFYGSATANAAAETKRLEDVTAYGIVKAAVLKMSPKAVRRYRKTYGIDVDSSLPDEEVTDLIVKHCLSLPMDPNETVYESLRILMSSTPVDSGGEEECGDIKSAQMSSYGPSKPKPELKTTDTLCCCCRKVHLEMSSRSTTADRLNYFTRAVYKTVLAHADPVTGLFGSPIPGFKGHAWVRDNVYAVHCVWGLALAYRNHADVDADRSTGYELEQACNVITNSPMILQNHRATSAGTVAFVVMRRKPVQVASRYRTMQGQLYYDWDLKQCLEFTYGGCEGNANNFDSIEECEVFCPDEEQEGLNPFELPAEIGPCKSTLHQVLLQQRIEEVRDIYMWPMPNNFETKADCERKCSVKGAPADPDAPAGDACSLPKDTGPCKASFRKWFFDSRKKFMVVAKAVQTDSTLRKSASNDVATLPASLICRLPYAMGSCRANMKRFFYDFETKQCRAFTYTDCEGNANNFATAYACCAKCASTCVKVMRSLLACFMRQSKKVENFKSSQAPKDSLHAKYSSHSLNTVVGDEDWGHLQIDAIALYLLTLAQMTASGLQVVFSLDEVAFVQNLVFYIEHAYRIPDFGIWERGDKTNHGVPELNATSIGMTKAALEALNGLDLFGAFGSPNSVIHVMGDEIQECQAVLRSLLPRESYSKETDAGLLSIISYPAFAVEDLSQINTTRATIVDKLQGRYGCRRFLRDGYETAKEDPRRLYYEPHELQKFENIECEWPLFFCYLFIDAHFNNNQDKMKFYRNYLDKVVIEIEDGLKVIPKLYVLAEENIDAELKQPHSQDRYANDAKPFLWAQSLYILGCLIEENLIKLAELDPLNRRLSTEARPDTVVQGEYERQSKQIDVGRSGSVAILAEDEDVLAKISAQGIEVELVKNTEPFVVLPARILGRMYAQLGRSHKMNLTGRKSRDVGLLSTSKMYIVEKRIFVFTPQFLDWRRFYLTHDMSILIDTMKSELLYVKTSWNVPGRPLVVLLISSGMITGMYSNKGCSLMLSPSKDEQVPLGLIGALKKIKSGYLSGTRFENFEKHEECVSSVIFYSRTIMGKISDFVTTSCITKLHFLSTDEIYCVLVLTFLAEDVDPEMRAFLRKIIRGSRATPNPLLQRRRDSKPDQVKTLPAFVRGMSQRRRSMLLDPNEAAQNKPTSEGQMTNAKSDLRRHSGGNADSGRTSQDREDNGIPPVPLLKSQSQEKGSPSSTCRSPTRKNVDFREVQCTELVELLLDTDLLEEQADILEFLWSKQGPEWDTKLGGKKNVTVRMLVEEIHYKASSEQKWWLVRYTAGLLNKVTEALTNAVTALIIRQKQVTIGLPNVREKSIVSPQPPKELLTFIRSVMSDDQCGVMITQEVLIYLGMFIRTEPHLFSEMLRLRVGLIIQIMISELARSMSISGEQAAAELTNLSPYELKTLLHHLISGKEIMDRGDETVRNIMFTARTKQERSGILRLKKQLMRHKAFANDPSYEDINPEQTFNWLQWLRRRRIDSALNRVPSDFYSRIWRLLRRYEGLIIGGQVLHRNLTQEVILYQFEWKMTTNEYKFALTVESVLNKIPDPEYRQLIVEVMMVLILLNESHTKLSLGTGFVNADSLVIRANEIFLIDQRALKGDALGCCCGEGKKGSCGGAYGICRHFYDSAPSGRYGTITYICRGLVALIPQLREEIECSVVIRRQLNIETMKTESEQVILRDLLFSHRNFLPFRRAMPLQKGRFRCKFHLCFITKNKYELRGTAKDVPVDPCVLLVDVYLPDNDALTDPWTLPLDMPVPEVVPVDPWILPACVHLADDDALLDPWILPMDVLTPEDVPVDPWALPIDVCIPDDDDDAPLDPCIPIPDMLTPVDVPFDPEVVPIDVCIPDDDTPAEPWTLLTDKPAPEDMLADPWIMPIDVLTPDSDAPVDPWIPLPELLTTAAAPVES
ncbi:hypothetical protein M514_24426, partial [Trichuris suis]